MLADLRYNFNLRLEITSVQITTVTLEEGVQHNISSPNYPGNYNDNSFQLWDIQAPKGFVVSVSFHYFATESGYDFLYFGDSVDSFSTNNKSCTTWLSFSGWESSGKNFPSSSSAIQFIFTSDYANNQNGFLLQLSAVRMQNSTFYLRDNFTIENDTDHLVSSNDNSIALPSSGPLLGVLIFNSANDLRIRIRFDLYCMKDSDEIVEVGDGSIPGDNKILTRFSGSSTPDDVISVSNSAWMVIKYPRYKPLRFRVVIATEGYEYELLTNDSVVSKTLRFPKLYPENAYEMWSLRAPDGYAISVNILQLTTEEGKDFLLIGDGADHFSRNSSQWRQFSGTITSVGYQSMTSSLLVIFSSDGKGVSEKGSGYTIVEFSTVFVPRTTTSNLSISNEIGSVLYSTTASTPASNHLNVIMIATFSSTSFILLLVVLRWVQIKVRRRHLRQLRDRRYYEVHKVLPDLPPRKGLENGQDAKNRVGVVPFSSSSSMENIYEIIPEDDLSDLDYDIPDDLGRDADASDSGELQKATVNDSNEDEGADGYTLVPDTPVQPVGSENEVAIQASVITDDYEVIDGEKPSCGGQRSKANKNGVQTKGDDSARRVQPRKTQIQHSSLIETPGGARRNSVRISAVVHSTFSDSSSIKETWLPPNRKPINDIVDGRGYLMPTASQKSGKKVRVVVNQQSQDEDNKESLK